MKNDPLSLSERIQAFTRELALSMRRITGRIIEPDLPPVVQPVEDQERLSKPGATFSSHRAPR